MQCKTMEDEKKTEISLLHSSLDTLKKETEQLQAKERARWDHYRTQSSSE